MCSDTISEVADIAEDGLDRKAVTQDFAWLLRHSGLRL